MSDYETAQQRRNIIVGVFVILALCALGVMIYKFGELPTSVSKFGSFQIFVQFPSAPGVEKDTPVRFCGYQIGRVTRVMAPEIRTDLNTGSKYHQTVVVLSIDKRYVNIPSNVEVKLMTRGLGSSYIEFKVDPSLPLTARDPNLPETKFLVKDMVLQGSTGMTSEFFPEESQKKLEELVNGIKTFVDNANSIIGDPNNKQNLKTTLANLSEATEQATKTLKEFQDFSAAGTATVKSADAKMEKVVAALVDTSEQLSKTTVELRLILEKINRGEGTAARLVKDGRFYENLLENTEQLQALLKKLESLIDKANEKGLHSIW
ncbi:MAG TPA: MlaD family protein [Sedimentisphaerales bacterium]|nr:MlaD family protein [Sedimentisphaerales bacterium]